MADSELNVRHSDRMRNAPGSVAEHVLAVVRELAFARDLESISGIVRSAARALTGADGVTFVLREGGLCHYADEDAIAPLWKGRRFPMSTCISGWVMRRGEPVAIPDIYADTRIPHEAYRATFVKSLVMVPVRAPDPIAAIGAYWARPHAATREELTTLQTLADSAGLALANVHLYEDLRVALGRERQAREAAEAATGAKDDFLQMVAHELRQPLAACAAAASVMALRPESPAGASARDVVRRQVTHMTRLVDDLLDAARIVRGQVRLFKRTVDLRETAREALDSVSTLLEERRHDVETALPDLPLLVLGDPDRLRQVLINLLTNAAKYTPAGGRIVISASAGDGAIQLRVRDNGDGLEEHQIRRIFDLFTRATTNRDGGFGVGLAVARGLLRQHEGTIEARSAGPGRGSEFVVTLPALGVAA